jgi:hypothetical protein
VIDPEAGRTNRANQAWGERPALRPEDVATVELLDEGQRLRITPGPEAKGDLFVLFGALPEGTGELSRGREVLRTWALDDGLRVRGTLTTLHAVEGTVLAPPPGEATRMAALDQADSDDLSLLEALGYVGGEAH